ncbi:MAG TPA: hypothetical protein VHY09_08070 [Candidatus Methylacidiphilales bacterium]|nr:hypothetical protein [Candidatus Methylacidiphilales bacterium]
MAIMLTVLMTPGYAQLEDEPLLRGSLTARLVFEKSPDDPSFINVYLRVVNISNSDVTWRCDPILGFVVSLLNPAGQPTAPPAGGMSSDVMSGTRTFTLTPGSRLDLLISHDWGISVGSKNATTEYVLELASHVWYIPMAQAKNYTVHIKLYGNFGSATTEPSNFPPDKPLLLLSPPPQKLILSRS